MKLLKCSAILLALFLVALAPAAALEANETNMSADAFNILYIGNNGYYAFNWTDAGYDGDTGNVEYTVTAISGLESDWVTPHEDYLQLARNTNSKAANQSIGTNVSMADFDAVVIDMVALYEYPLGAIIPITPYGKSSRGAFDVTHSAGVPIISVRCGEWDGINNYMPSEFIYIRDNPHFTGIGALYPGNETILDAFFAQDPITGDFLIYDYTDDWFEAQQTECYNLVDYLSNLNDYIN
jgi:hypothetical protein